MIQVFILSATKERKKGKTMGATKRGKRDGTGPYKGSYQRKRSKKGKRQQRGEKCPKK